MTKLLMNTLSYTGLTLTLHHDTISAQNFATINPFSFLLSPICHQDAFVSVLRQRAAAEEGKVHYFRDTYAEHPADRKNIE